MAQRAAVNLSDLPEGDHLVKDTSNQGTCVVYMKLTEACVKAIDTLLAAKKGANDCGLCVSFNPSGGTFTVPGDALSETKAFEFQTNKIEKGSVECLHQHRLIQGSKQTGQTLSNFGSIHHKLSIKATDDVYEATKTKALEAEEERKESHRVKQIEKLPSTRAPLKYKRPIEVPNSHQVKVPPKKPDEPTTSNSTNLRIFRDRVIHFLALKPHRKVDLHNRLKKDKHCENSLSHLDSLLQQVAEQSPHDRAVYNLKASYYSEVKVDTFPKYSEQERVTVRRNLQEAGIKVPSSGVKRTAASEDSPNITKRAKSHSTMKHAKPMDTTTTATTITDTNPNTTTATTAPQVSDNDTLLKNPVVDTINNEKTKKIPLMTDVTPVEQKKHKKKKKHKHIKAEETAEISMDVTKPSPQEPLLPSAPVEDDLSRFSTITSLEQRARYKEEFNAEYSKYTELKNKFDQVTIEFNELKSQLASCPKRSDEYKRLSHSIKKKYKEKQNDEAYKQEKLQYQQLCTKLNHIKKLVIEYDNNFIIEQSS